MSLLKYYFKNHFLYGIIFGIFIAITQIIGSIINPGVISLTESIVFALMLFIPIGIFCTSLLFWYGEIYTPKKMKKMMKHRSLIQFKEKGFKEKDGVLQGDYDKYPCRVWWSPYSPVNIRRSSINFFISCKPSKFQLKNLSEMYKKEELILSENGMLGFCLISIKTPNPEKIKNKIQSMIKILKDRNIKPLDFVDETTTANKMYN